ncbi:MAG: hypothetical protein OXH52_12240 [Gammaproteobacteria bacterium]|nr:hypothetical protein [Gammaproteobacteria bacterium]
MELGRSWQLYIDHRPYGGDVAGVRVNEDSFILAMATIPGDDVVDVTGRCRAGRQARVEGLAGRRAEGSGVRAPDWRRRG